jgi:hypothetical protein
MPLNNHMKTLLRAAEDRSGKLAAPQFGSPIDDKDAFRSMERWKVLHNIRTVIGAVGWTAAMSVIFFL